MIQVKNIILQVRQKTGDNDYSDIKYSDNEIIDSINLALSSIAIECLCFNKDWLITPKDDVYVYPLPLDFLQFHSLTVNNKKILQIGGITNNGIYFDLNQIYFKNIDIKAKDAIILNYFHYERVGNAGDSIYLPFGILDALIYHVLSLLYQNPISKEHINKSTYYLNLYDKSIMNIKSIIRSQFQQKNIISMYRKV